MKHPGRPARFCTLVLAVAVAVGHAVAAQTAQSAPAKSFLWKVESGPRVLYLAGSVHALTADVYPLNPAFERAFQASDLLVEELDLSQGDLLTLGPMLLAKGMYQDGRTFNTVVSKETAALVNKHLDNAMALELIRGMKPWMVMMVVSAMQMQQAGLNVNLGLDKYFFDKAKAAGKAVLGLETAEYQIDRFDTMPESLQEQLLRSTLEELDAQGRELTEIVTAWQRGDAASLERSLLSGFKQYPAAYRSLIVERNHNWMAQFDKCLARATPCLVVVGAAHLVGPDGLLTLLRQKGYRVEQQ
jgi:uncharacterized protein YbaP (TraB family)